MNETINIILKVFGGLGVIVVGIKALIYLFTPVTSTKKKLEEHEEILKEHEEYLKKDKENIEYLTTLMKDCMKLELSMINHTIDGNGIDKMKELREEMTNKFF